MNLIAIDPSLRGTGIAYFTDGILVDAHILKAQGVVPRRKWGNAACTFSDFLDGDTAAWPDHVICEIPQIYKKSPGDPNDLVAVSLVAGALLGAFECDSTTVWPAEWKGQVPKQVHHPRIMGMLTPSETKLLEPVKKTTGAAFHNVMDAVGLGLWHLKKTGARV